MAFGEVELRGLAILTSIWLVYPFGAENVLPVIANDSFSTGWVSKRNEAIAIINASLLGFQRQQNIHHLSKLLEVALELL